MKDGENAVTKVQPKTKQVDVFKSILNSASVQDAFGNVLKERKSAFLANLLQVVQTNPDLQQAEPKQVLTGAMAAATLDLPLQKDLGYSALVPYKVNGKVSVQFQIMTRGYVQLAQRSGRYKTIHVTEVYADEIESYDIMTGDVTFKPVENGWRAKDWAGDASASQHIAGYAATFILLNGFRKTEYWPVARIDAHVKKFSKSYGFSGGPWQSNREAMRKKTVLKALLRGYGPMSVMDTAISLDGVSGNDMTLDKIERDEDFDFQNQTLDQAPEPEPTAESPHGAVPGGIF